MKFIGRIEYESLWRSSKQKVRKNLEVNLHLSRNKVYKTHLIMIISYMNKVYAGRGIHEQIKDRSFWHSTSLPCRNCRNDFKRQQQCQQGLCEALANISAMSATRLIFSVLCAFSKLLLKRCCLLELTQGCTAILISNFNSNVKIRSRTPSLLIIPREGVE